jgi:hypothetical protein
MTNEQLLEHLKKEAEQLVGNLNALSGRLHHNQEMQKLLTEGEPAEGRDAFVEMATKSRLNEAEARA